MASSSTYAFFQSARDVPHCSLQHLSWDTNFVSDPLFQFIQCPWPSRVDPILKVAPQKKKKITNGQVRWSWWPELPLHIFQTIIVFVKHFYDESTLLADPLFHDYWMARLSVAQRSCSAVLPTVHGCHYPFQKFPFFCVTLYVTVFRTVLRILRITQKFLSDMNEEEVMKTLSFTYTMWVIWKKALSDD